MCWPGGTTRPALPPAAALLALPPAAALPALPPAAALPALPPAAAGPNPAAIDARGGWCCCASRFLSLPVTPGNRFAKPSGVPACQSWGPPTSRTPQEKSDDNLPSTRLTSRQCPLYHLRRSG